MTGIKNPAVRVGWIGTGRMGAALAIRLMMAGHDVAVYNRTRAKAEALADYGAIVADKPTDLADRDVVFTMVSGPDDLLEVTSGAGGVLTGAGAPRILVDTSTVSAEASARVRVTAAAAGTAFLAAPVSGNPKVARSGGLTLAVSGPEDAYREAEPLLLELGRAVAYVGGEDVARLVKICHNVLLGVMFQSLCEITVLAERGGTSRAAFLGFLNDSVLGSTFSRYKSPAIVNLDFTPTFTMPLLLKDFDLGMAASRSLGVPMPVAAATAQIIASAVGAGHQVNDFAELILEQARRAGFELEPEDTEVDDGLGS